ncbi:C40 family peptidase [Microscilla marina]|uniref:Dipeptidyl peptidase VI n=1 Tax=Microscilla marina ATCC 23134 TaxID=313606 RepID=A1ZEV3_MICM2|nr:C40 family peptidase [Microscilla marina]EAY31055.1 dipeptidyl peptidase VI [Microscilla marina ATCC 23134]
MKKNFLFSVLALLMTVQVYALDYGICAQSVVAVRKTTSAKSEQVTQLVFGDAYKVLKWSPNKKWAYIENSYDNYHGWIEVASVFRVSKDYFTDYHKNAHPVVAEKLGVVKFKGEKIPVSLGSTLPFYKKGEIKLGNEIARYVGKASDITNKQSKEKIIKTAEKLLKIPYLWGGKGKQGYDCSGFAQMVFKTNGYILPRDSYQQAEKGKTVSLAEAQPGDLVFFQRKPQYIEKNGRVVHVGIVYENKNKQLKVIHSAGMVRINKLDKTGLYRDDLGKYSHYFKFIKRLE